MMGKVDRKPGTIAMHDHVPARCHRKHNVVNDSLCNINIIYYQLNCAGHYSRNHC